MPISIKSAREIELMTEAGRILAIVHEEMEKALRPGMTTKDIDRLGEEVIRSYGCVPSFLNYNGYPASVCVSVNDEVVHGIPTDKRVIREGDVVSLDAGVIYKGYHSDAARTHAVGAISPEAAKLIRVTEESFFEGMKYAKEGNYLYEISNAIGRYAEQHGYGVVRDLCGHGIGSHHFPLHLHAPSLRYLLDEDSGNDTRQLRRGLLYPPAASLYDAHCGNVRQGRKLRRTYYGREPWSGGKPDHRGHHRYQQHRYPARVPPLHRT